MDKAFYQHILDKQQITGAVPSNKANCRVGAAGYPFAVSRAV